MGNDCWKPFEGSKFVLRRYREVGLSKCTTTEGLRSAFAKLAKVVTDRLSDYSKCYGFVRYATVEEAAAGIKGMDGQFLDGWVIFAEYAIPRPPPPSLNNAPTYNQP